MPYDEHLANRVREKFVELPNVTEKEMMGGLTNFSLTLFAKCSL